MQTAVPSGLLMPFGKYRDKHLDDVPADYLQWLLANCKLSSGLRSAVAEELARHGIEAPPPAPAPMPTCNRCGNVGHICRWKTLRDGRRMIRAECRGCSGLLKRVAMTPENIQLANENER